MKLCFYNQEGNLFGYCEDETYIYTFDGKPVAYIDVEDVYAFKGTHLGYLEDGNVWDRNGNMLLFTDNSKFGVGPLKPKKSLKPKKGLKSLMPLKGKKVLKSKNSIISEVRSKKRAMTLLIKSTKKGH